jgi:hypothetical protein
MLARCYVADLENRTFGRTVAFALPATTGTKCRELAPTGSDIGIAARWADGVGHRHCIPTHWPDDGSQALAPLISPNAERTSPTGV